MERFSFHKSTSQTFWGLSFLIQFYKTVVSEYLILFVVNLETNISLNPTWKKMKNIYQLLMVLSFIKKNELKKICNEWASLLASNLQYYQLQYFRFYSVFYGKEVRFSFYLAFHFIHYYNVLSCIKEQNLFTFVVNCIFKWSWNKLINANHIKKT